MNQRKNSSPQKKGAKQQTKQTKPKNQKQMLAAQAKQKAIQLLNKQRFERDWQVVARGESFRNYQFTIITQTLSRIMNSTKDLVAASQQISRVVGANLGFEYWNVIIANGQFSRKTYASGGYYAIFKRHDGLQAIIWHNKLSIQNTMQKSIVKQSQYF